MTWGERVHWLRFNATLVLVIVPLAVLTEAGALVLECLGVPFLTPVPKEDDRPKGDS